MTEIEITKDNFVEEVLKGGTPILLDFWAEWCGPCKMLAPVLEEFADQHDEIRVGTINVDAEPELASTFEVESIPSLFVMRDGTITARRIGYCTKEQLEELISL